MQKSIKIYIAILITLLLVIVIIDINKPIPINWAATYDTKDKIPFGLYVLDKEIPAILENRRLKKLDFTPYEYFHTQDANDSSETLQVEGTFLRISEFSDVDKSSSLELLNFASQGNSVFLSMKDFPKVIVDSLKLAVNGEYQYTDSIFNWLASSKLGTKKFNLVEGIGNNYFSKIDTTNTRVLGFQSGDSTRINFIKVKYKAGNFFLHTQPVAFTNFHLLKKNNFEYAEKVLSYLPKADVIWYTKNQNGEKISSSPLRFIFSQPALKAAWFLFLIGMLLFMIFNAKRRQRVVPIIKPLQNSSIDFTKTIGNLYFQEGEHGNLIDKKVIYFLDKIRSQYLLETTILDDNFIKKLHQKSGKNLVEIQSIVFMINHHRKNNFQSVESDLIELNSHIERFFES
jgi:hypothetical protein